MASNESVAAIRPDIWEVELAGVNGDFIGILADVEVVFAPAITPLGNARTGQTVGLWNDETKIILKLSCEQSAKADWDRFLDVAGGAIPERGFLPARRIRMHDPAAADATGDLLFYAVVFTGVSHAADGKGNKRLVVNAEAIPDTTGAKFKVGDTF